MNSSSDQTEYKPAASTLTFLLWLLIQAIALWQLIRLVVFTISNPNRFLLLLVFYVVIIAYTIPYMYDLISKERLVLSKDGIRHETMFYTMSVKWDRVKQIEHSKFGLKRLAVEETPLEKTENKWIAWTWSVRSLSSTRDYIPLGVINWARYNDLEAELKKHAPHLDL
jgi:hypothetical protein